MNRPEPATDAAKIAPTHNRRQRRWHPMWSYAFLLPVVCVFIGGLVGVCFFCARNGMASATVDFGAVVGGVSGLIIGSLVEISVLAIRAMNRQGHRPAHGCLIAGTLVGSLAGGAIGSAIASTGPLDANFSAFGTLTGAIGGLWLAVMVERFDPQSADRDRFPSRLAALVQFTLLLGLTLAVIWILSDWIDLRRRSHALGWESMRTVGTHWHIQERGSLPFDVGT